MSTQHKETNNNDNVWTAETLAADIHVRFSTEQHALAELYRRGNQHRRFRCLRCGNEHVAEGHTSRSIKCGCGRLHFITAHTFLHRMKKPLAWLAGIIFFEEGVVTSNHNFGKLFHVSPDTASRVCDKVSAVIGDEIEKEYAEVLLVPSAEFMEIFAKRSLETPPKKRPVTEEECVDQLIAQDQVAYAKRAQQMMSQAGFTELTTGSEVDQAEEPLDKNGVITNNEQSCSADKDVGMNAEHLSVFEHLSDEPIALDELCVRTALPTSSVLTALTFIELDQLLSILPGNRYARRQSVPANPSSPRRNPKLPEDAKNAVVAAVHFLRPIFKGISRKYLQLYLARYWSAMIRSKEKHGCLLDSCLRYGTLLEKELRARITPPIVNLANCI